MPVTEIARNDWAALEVGRDHGEREPRFHPVPGSRRSVMADLTKLESKLGEVPGLVRVADEVQG
jgi:hypothetical protein